MNFKKKKSKPKKHAWYKKKGYLHFDLPLTQANAVAFVTDKKKIERHRFSPLIHYKKESVKLKRDKEAEAIYKKTGRPEDKPKFKPKYKKRNIFYSSHLDGYVYSYYTYKLKEKYENFLKESSLTDNVIAYRAIEKKGERYSNINLAKEVFDFIKGFKEANVLCFDLSKFFDKLDKDILKRNWIKILGEDRLPEDHFKVYKSVTSFSFVDEAEIIQNFRDRFKASPRNHGFKKAKGEPERRICEYKELRNLHEQFKTKNLKLIKRQSQLEISGVAQGTAISGMLSNIFMIEFDLLMKKSIEDLGGCYRRYSDDIFVCVNNASFEDISNIVEQAVKATCGCKIELNKGKTELRKYFVEDGRGKVTCSKDKASRIQYLGFFFDGEKVHIRTSSMSKDRGKIIQTIRKNKDTKSGIDSKAVYKSKSSRVISPHNSKAQKGFAYYAERASAIHGDSKSIEQQVKHKTDKFIRKAIKTERKIDADKVRLREEAKAYKQSKNLEKRILNKLKKAKQ